MSKEINNIDWLMNDPNSRKWIQQCVVCQTIGIKQDTPEKYFNRKWIERGLKRINFNELGICENCENLLRRP